MKDRLQHDVAKVEAALIQFHRRPSDADPGEIWQRRLMTRIRDVASAAPEAEGFGARLGGLAWRFAVASSVAAVVLAAYAVQADLKTQYEVAELSVTTAPAVFDIATSFGVLREGGGP